MLTGSGCQFPSYSALCAEIYPEAYSTLHVCDTDVVFLRLCNFIDNVLCLIFLRSVIFDFRILTILIYILFLDNTVLIVALCDLHWEQNNP